jgi:hypothetical protein
MKRILLLTTVMVLGATMAFAQGGYVGIFNSPVPGPNPLDNCHLPDNVAGLCSYYVIHMGTPGATATQFSAPQPACMLAVFLSDTAVYPVTIGGSQGGVAIGYGACIGSPNNVLIINYFCQALTPPCCEYPILPDPNVPSGSIEVVDCLNNLITGVGSQSGWINGDSSCPCEEPVATEETTWGKVKALYSE